MAEDGEQKTEDRGQQAEDPSPLVTGPLSPSPRFGDYELLEEIGQGGMGVVWKARQVTLNRTVAVKMIRAGPYASKEFVHRFRMEASAAAVLQHPNIVAVHEVGVHQGQHFFSMDYVAGKDLAQLLRDGPLPAPRAARYVQKMAEAIQHAHESGILHRDLKPSNVIIDAHDEPRITDFGLAKQLHGDSTVTMTGEVIGTPAYMPPEQASGNRGAIKAWTDIYSLGAILYHLLTGRAPFAAPSLEETIQQVLHRDPVSVRLLNPAVPRDLETICLKCLEKEPAKRYVTAQLLADELGRYLQKEPILARPISRAGRIWRWCRRNPRVATATGMAFLSLVIGLAGTTWGWRRAKVNELLARQNVYAADMKLAQLALLDNNVGLALTLLKKHRPSLHANLQSPISNLQSADLRHWEWRYLWQLCQGDESEVLHQYSKAVRGVAVSQDGKTLALRTDGDLVALWDLTTRRPLREVTDATEALALSPSGSLLAFGARDGRGKRVVEVWDVQAGKLRSTLPQASSVSSLSFSPDDALLAIFDRAGQVAVVELPSKLIATHKVRPTRRGGGVGRVAFSPDGSQLAVGQDYGELEVWNWRTGTALRIETQTDEGVTELAYSPPGELIAVGFGYPSGRIGLWDPRSGQARGQLTNQATVVTALAFSPDGRLLAASDVSQTIRLWHVPEQVERPCLRAYRGGVAALAFLPDGKTLLSGGNDGAVRLWDVTAPPRIRGHTNLVISYGYADRARVEPQGFAPGALLDPLAVCRFGFTFTPDGQSVLMPDKEGFIDVWQVRSVQRTDRLTLLGSNNWDVALSPDGRWLAAGKTTGTVTIWEWTARQAVTNFTIPFDWFGRVRFSRSGRFLLAGTVLGNYEAGNYKATWRIWRAGDWQEVPLPASLLEGLFAVDLSPDEHLLAGGYDNGAVRLWKFPAGLPQAAFTNYSGRVNGVLFSPDGQTLFSAGDDVQVRFWDVSARRELGPFAGLTGVYGVACSADGRRLVTGSGSVKDPVKLWDLATHRELLALQGQGTYFVGLSFSPDGNTLIGTTLSGIANFWRVPSWEDIRAVDHASGQTK